MVFAMAFGLGLGSLAGLSVGPYIFEKFGEPKHYSKLLGEVADHDKMVEPHDPAKPVNAEMRSLLPLCEPWVEAPDYERVSMINRIIAVMWPNLTKAVMTEVMKQVKPQLDAQVFSKFKFIEDIVLGTMSMKDARCWDTWIKDKSFTVGGVPPRVGGIKGYNTSDDEVILEVPLMWGSNCKFNAGVFLRFGQFRLYVPLEIENLYFKIETRITIKPLVEHIPCVGGATVTLLKAPVVDLTLRLIKGVDLMALPGIKDAVNFGIKYVLNGMLIYPNSMSFPIMPNFGVPPPPKGALKIRLQRAEGLKGDTTYVKLEIRKGRPMTSKTVKHSHHPEFNEEFNLIVDDYIEQTLDVTVYEDDFGWNDTPIGTGQLTFGEVINSVMDPATGKYQDEVKLKDFIKSPMHEEQVAIPLVKPYMDERGEYRSNKSLAKDKKHTKTMSRILSTVKGGSSRDYKPEPRGTLYMVVKFLPFLSSTYDDEDEDAKGGKPKPSTAGLPPRPAGRSINTGISDRTQGVLTVNLIRCINLVGDNPDAYVLIKVVDEESDHPDLAQTSPVIFNENSPRFNAKFDFVMIRAGSYLYLTVYNKQSLTSSLLSTVNPFKKKKTADAGGDDPILGKLMLPIKDVARNSRLKDIWTLSDTEHGNIELALSWQSVETPDEP